MYNKIVYMLALLLQEGKFSCVKASKGLILVSHDHLTRLLNKSDLKCSVDIKNLPKGGDLAIDDTVIPKKHCKSIENCSYVYSSLDDKVVFGLNFILVTYEYKGKIYILDVIMWKKGGPTKNELVRDYLITLKEKGLCPNVVLFDKWYNAYQTLNLLERLNWKYVTLSNGNRVFNSKADNKELDLKKTEKRAKRSKKKSNTTHVDDYNYFGARGRFGRLNKVNHTVQIIKNGDRYVLTNILEPLNSVKAWKLYQRRWVIETIFRDLKSFLHLNQCSLRSAKAQKNHIVCCLDAYLYLREKYPNKSVESAHQEFLQKHRKLIPQPIEAYLKDA